MTEAKFQAIIAQILMTAFGLTPAEVDIEHTITVRLGRNVHTVKSGWQVYAARGRADIIIRKNGKPLAVIELKKPGIGLTADDGNQGLSYARLMNPMAPLVIATDGGPPRLIDTYTGEVIDVSAAPPSAEMVAQRLTAASRLASRDLTRALDTLMGPDAGIWAPALRRTSLDLIAERTGSWSQTRQPFVEGFLLPRHATQGVETKLTQGQRVVFLAGDPLMGKSNVLKELVLRNSAPEKEDADSPPVVLYIEGSSRRQGLFEGLAKIFDAELAWPIEASDVRRWLRDRAEAAGPRLVLAVDGLPRQDTQVLADVEDVASWSGGVQVVLAVSPDDATRLASDETGRSDSLLGRRAATVTVEALNSLELELAHDHLEEHGVSLADGYKVCRDYRTPWVLRSIAGAALARPGPAVAAANVKVRAPSVVGLELFDLINGVYGSDEALMLGYGKLARAFMNDVGKRGRGPEVALEGLAVFAIRPKVLREQLKGADIRVLKDNGLLRETRVGEAIVFIPALPELMAWRLAAVMGAKLVKKAEKDPGAAATWLVEHTNQMPMGDLIGARAIQEAAGVTGDIPLGLIESLLSARPRRETMGPGFQGMVRIPGAGVASLRVDAQGQLEVRHGDKVVALDMADEQTTYADTESWNVLAHLAGRPLGLVDRNNIVVTRADPVLLKEIGQAPMPMIKPPRDEFGVGVEVQDLPDGGSFVTFTNGIVEPITESIFRYLGGRPTGVDDWLDEIVAVGNIPLLARVDLALRELAETENVAVHVWAADRLRKDIHPALAQALRNALAPAIPAAAAAAKPSP